MTASAPRTMVVWCPDWPVTALLEEERLSAELPVAVLSKGLVHSCSPAARADGVRRGQRRRDAVSRCPELVLVDSQPERDARVFERVLRTVEEISPGVEALRPGLAALPVPSRYYGGEAEAAAVVAERLVATGTWDCRFGVADGLFAAEQAARLAAVQDSRVVPPGESAGFLAGLEVGVLEDPELVSLLRRMGIHTLGDFARLATADVATRFGRTGLHLHRLARGEDRRGSSGRTPPPELTREVSFAPGLETIEPIAFSSRETASLLVGELSRLGQVCTGLRIEVETEDGWQGSRRWSHPRWFSEVDVVDRLRWQLQAEPAPDPVRTVRFVPEVVESMGSTGDGLWGSAPDERIERGMARVQSLVGFDGVLTPSVQGGRQPAERQLFSPWGEQGTATRAAGLPWPGRIPPPAPTRVFADPVPAQVLAADGRPVSLTGRGLVSAEPVGFQPDRGSPVLPVEAWAGPWPIDVSWWDPERARQVARFQLVGADGSAWLLVAEGDRWWTEARYD
ncbi:DNA polymerase Y family protein [Desertihabitans aurantiacus]|uniref:DNA polymerase Y family protein n=1 Tax=Desertihabitans aurantiacus TaxID=2282477 RepID=UPI000DF85726|nr:DNA polymerase Y family protein [Desertihabitans aurantiacus]